MSASLALSLSAPNPGSGGYVDELRGGRLSGFIETQPYPILRVPARGGQGPRAIMLSGQGKAGVADAARPLDSQWAEVSGIFVKRGDLDMLLIGGSDGLRAATLPTDVGQPVKQFRWAGGA